MSVEMGPRDVDLKLKEQFAGQFIRLWAWVVGVVSDDVTYRFRASTATLFVSGESEHTGDPFVAGRFAESIASVNMVAMMAVLAYCGIAVVSLRGVAYPGLIAGAALLTACVAFVSLIGSASVASKIDVVDHTTEAPPDAVDEP